jgi:hypothetical protein
MERRRKRSILCFVATAVLRGLKTAETRLSFGLVDQQEFDLLVSIDMRAAVGWNLIGLFRQSPLLPFTTIHRLRSLLIWRTISGQLEFLQ